MNGGMPGSGNDSAEAPRPSAFDHSQPVFAHRSPSGESGRVRADQLQTQVAITKRAEAELRSQQQEVAVARRRKRASAAVLAIGDNGAD
jgi:hypothetical protein